MSDKFAKQCLRVFHCDLSHAVVFSKSLLSVLWCTVFILFTQLLIPPLTSAETYVSGAVSGTWTVEGSPYIVTGDLSVSNLVINPGVEVILDSETSTVFIAIQGQITANGQEGDSIYFHVADEEMSYFAFRQYGTSNPSLFHYCRMEGTVYFFADDTSTEIEIRQCSFPHIWPWDQACFIAQTGGYLLLEDLSINSNIFETLVNYGSVADITNVTIGSACVNSSFFVSHAAALSVDSLVMDNGRINIFDSGNIVVINSCIKDIYVYNTQSTLVENSRICTFSSRSEGNTEVTIMNNTFEYLGDPLENNRYNPTSVNIQGGQATFQNNIVDGGLYCNYLSSSSISYNLIKGNQIYNDCDGDYVNNTTVYQPDVPAPENTVITFADGGSLSIYNNLVIGYGDNTTNYGMYFNETTPAILRNNWFFRTGEMIGGPDPGFDNFAGDPRVTDLANGDLTLQAVSPLIDAGHANFNYDPDGSPPDIGAFYFDHRINHSPVYDAPRKGIAVTGHMFRYAARATDDGDAIDISYLNYPVWLHVELEEDELDAVEDSLVLTGMVPEDAEDFLFVLQYDTPADSAERATVHVRVCRSQLEGPVSGRLSIAESPVYISNNIYVNERDQLTIDPGVELLFRDTHDLGALVGFDIYGTVTLAGTAEDSIYFRSATSSAVDAWQGVYAEGDGILNLDYLVIEHALQPLWLEHYRDINLSHCRVSYYWGYCLLAPNDQATLLDSRFNHCGNNGVTLSAVLEKNCTIRNCSFYDIAKSAIRGHIVNIVVDSCDFTDCEKAILVVSDDNSNHYRVYYSNNTLNNLLYGVFIDNYLVPYSYIYINNNISRDVNMFYAYNEALRSHNNSILTNNTCINGRYFVIDFNSIEDNVTYKITNNIIDVDQYVFYSSFMEGVRNVRISYNQFVDSDIIHNVDRATLDSTENQCGDPLFVDAENGDYRLQPESPCIDTGDPEFPPDPDGSRSDRGALPFDPSWPAPDLKEAALPTEDAMLPGYPNPFNSTIMIPLELKQPGEVTLTVFNILGQQVAKRSLGQLGAGRQVVTWNSLGLSDMPVSSGVYFVCVHIARDGRSAFDGIQKVILLQ